MGSMAAKPVLALGQCLWMGIDGSYCVHRVLAGQQAMLNAIDKFGLNIDLKLGKQIKILYNRSVQRIFQRHDTK